MLGAMEVTDMSRRGLRNVALVLNLLLPVFLVLGTARVSGAGETERREAKYLFICAGDQARKAPDFLAVINFDQDSDAYGKVIATAPFASPDAVGNEPHHIGLSSDGRIVGCGGLLRADF